MKLSFVVNMKKNSELSKSALIASLIITERPSHLFAVVLIENRAGNARYNTIIYLNRRRTVDPL